MTDPHDLADPVADARADQRNLSFRVRRGRVSDARKHAIATFADRWGLLVTPTPLDLVEEFGRSAPVILDVGFGMGDATAEMAAADPDRDVIAVDVHTPGIGNLLRRIETEGLHHVRVVDGDAVMVLRDMLRPGGVDEVRVYFPDPWPKRAQQKRRLLDPAFLTLVAARLRPGGLLHVATDWDDYVRTARIALAQVPELSLEQVRVDDPPAHRPRTKFERRGIALGHTITDLLIRRT